MSEPSRALVTGASKGIGLAITERLLAEGYDVIGLSRDPPSLDNPRFEAVCLDLANLDELAVKMEGMARSLSDLTAVVLNAGRGEFRSLEEFSYRQIRDLMDLNFVSQAYVARAFLPRLKAQGGGDLVFIGSEAALAGRRQGSIYCASKFALRGFAQALREESARSGVRVTLINPGMVQTGFFDRLSFAPGPAPENYVQPADVAEAVWLALNARPGTVLDEINLSPLKRVVRSRPTPR